MKFRPFPRFAFAPFAALTLGACNLSGGGPDGEKVDLQIAGSIEVPAADAKAEAIVAAANAFLGNLTPEQRNSAVHAFNDNEQRQRWSNFPTGFVERGGLMRGTLTQQQNAALDTFLGQVLSENGLRNARLQMAADDVLRQGNSDSSVNFGSGSYSIAFVGAPSTTRPWMIQFGGHHLAINVTFVGSQASFSPMLTGGQPMTVQFAGQRVYITREEYRAAQAFLASLNSKQRRDAIRSAEPAQLLLGPGEYGTAVAPEGVRGADLTDPQRALLLAVIQARVGQFNARDAAAKMAAVRARINDTYFGWWGQEGAIGAAYYRITGPEIVIEYAPQQMGNDDPTEHAHNMYRDPTNDYGGRWIAAR